MSKTTESKTFKQLKAVMKDVNGDNRQIIRTYQLITGNKNVSVL